jgi:Fe-S-cluster-containing dehydrogenase component/CRP-like cAMP-binding protein
MAQVSGSAHVALLKGIPFFAHVPVEDLAKFAEFAILREFDSGADIVVQRNYGTSMFVLVAGRVEISVTTPTGERRLDALERTGDIFGEGALLGRGERTATVRAAGRVVVLELEKHRFDVLDRRHEVRKPLARAFDERAIANALRVHPHLSALPESAVKDLARQATLRLVPKGAIVARDSDLADKVLLIKDGLVKATRKSGNEVSILAYYNTGDVIGYSGDRERDYDLHAFGLCEVIELPWADFEHAMKAVPELARRFHHDALKRPPRELTPTLAPVANKFLDGYMEVESLLVIDLDRCVRCGNCVRACHARHTFARFERRGPIFARADRNHVMLPTSCRHCRDPECMIGCPTGAIHRLPDGNVDIDNKCIGCDNCARKCPFGNITMRVLEPGEDRPNAEVTKRAVKCNLCRGHAYSNCVHECPRGAILRVDPLGYFDELAEVMESEQQAAIAWEREMFAASKRRVKDRSTWFVPWSFAIGFAVAIASVAVSLASGVRPASRLGIVFGAIAGGCLLAASSQGLRKRIRNRAIGGLEAWTQFHMMIGFVGFVAAGAHTGFSSGGVFTAFFLLVFALEIAIGIAGQIIYMTVPPALTRLERHGLSRLVEDLYLEQATQVTLVRERQDGLAADKIETAKRLAGDVRLRMQPTYDPAAHLASALVAAGGVERMRDLVEARCRLVDVRAQLRLHARMKAWLVAHVAIATALLLLLAFHLITALALV